MQGVDTKHPHRGFDNLWYVIEGSASTGHSTGPGGAMERARLSSDLLAPGDWARRVHAEAIGADELEEGQADAEFRGVLFWVNLASEGQAGGAERTVLQWEQIPVRQEGTDGSVLGEASRSPRNPALILDVELPTGGRQPPSRPRSRASRTCWKAGRSSVSTERRNRRSGPPRSR